MSDPNGYEAVVYDLDGTLVRLSVDWDAVANEARSFLAEAGVTPSDVDLWEALDVADEYGLRSDLESIIAPHERDGARASERLSTADDLVSLPSELPVGVCSLNCEAACRIALDKHELVSRVDTIVGRDSVPTRKPDPAPLLTTLDRLGASAEGAVFVGDSRRDEVTAERAGVDFVYVTED